MERILKYSLVEIGQDTKLIRLATLTTFVHSLLFILYLIYLVFQIVSLMQGSDNQVVVALQEMAIQGSQNPTLIVVFIVLCIVALI
jgi:hypothetical protein